jgi:hypothetical protein
LLSLFLYILAQLNRLFVRIYQAVFNIVHSSVKNFLLYLPAFATKAMNSSEYFNAHTTGANQTQANHISVLQFVHRSQYSVAANKSLASGAIGNSQHTICPARSQMFFSSLMKSHHTHALTSVRVFEFCLHSSRT